jgi:hypothetical protein
MGCTSGLPLAAQPRGRNGGDYEMVISGAERRTQNLRSVARLLATFAKQVEVKRALEATDRQPHLDFWRVVYGGLSNLAVIEWCKLFGAVGSNTLHWQRVYADRLGEFRAGLQVATAMDDGAFTAYWREIKIWRDTEFAHFEPDAERPPTWPHFAAALKAADYYYGWVWAELDEGGLSLFPASLTTFRQTIRSDYDNAATLALASTKSLPQREL